MELGREALVVFVVAHGGWPCYCLLWLLELLGWEEVTGWRCMIGSWWSRAEDDGAADFNGSWSRGLLVASWRGRGLCFLEGQGELIIWVFNFFFLSSFHKGSQVFYVGYLERKVFLDFLILIFFPSPIWMWYNHVLQAKQSCFFSPNYLVSKQSKITLIAYVLPLHIWSPCPNIFVFYFSYLFWYFFKNIMLISTQKNWLMILKWAC